MSITGLVVPTFTQMLSAMSSWLDKAEAQVGAEADALLSARLAPDMFPLTTQIRFACVQAYEAVNRLRRQPFPPRVAELIEEGRAADERPGSLAESRARIIETVAMLKELAPDALDSNPSSSLSHELPSGMIFDLTAEQYARDWALGQFYFHVMIAYAILRHKGVELGKADYISHLLPFIRQSAS